MDDQLPIPEKTKKRDGKYQDAARLYIHKRITNFAELARLVGLPNSVHLLRVKDSDDWDGFTATIASSKLTSVWGQVAQLDGWSADSFARVKQERDRQVASIPALRAHIQELEKLLPTLEMGSKQHSSVVSSLKTLCSLLSDISGLDRFWKVMEQMNKKPDGFLGAERETRGSVIDL